MRKFLIYLLAFLSPCIASAKMVRDTVYTRQNDRIILVYDVTANGNDVSLRIVNKPRIIPGDNLRKACKGDLSLLKVVLFDRVGDFGRVKWNGMSPTAFTVPSGLSYDRSADGFYILGESSPMSFVKKTTDNKEVRLPLYVAVYQKKQTYRLVGSSSQPLRVTIGKAKAAKTQRVTKRTVQIGTETERVPVYSTEEVETAGNDDVVKALGSIQMVRQMIAAETELPFSQSLQMEIYNLRSMKERVNDTEVIERINEVLLDYSNKEHELKNAQNDASLAAQAEEQAMAAQQKAEEEAKEKEAEEKARIQEEKQQKRTLWMIIGGVILGVLGFVGNAVFKHFRDVRNQKSIMQMQESIARQAEHEAARRSREIIRNRAHKLANSGKSKLRESIQKGDRTKKSTKNTKIKSI